MLIKSINSDYDDNKWADYRLLIYLNGIDSKGL